MLAGMAVVRHWWNQKWGRIARRDVYVRSDGGRFEVEVVQGGAEGKRWVALFDTAEEAIGEAESHLVDPNDDWRDVSDAHRPARQV